MNIGDSSLLNSALNFTYSLLGAQRNLKGPVEKGFEGTTLRLRRCMLLKEKKDVLDARQSRVNKASSA
jgi:hypothetical protein